MTAVSGVRSHTGVGWKAQPAPASKPAAAKPAAKPEATNANAKDGHRPQTAVGARTPAQTVVRGGSGNDTIQVMNGPNAKLNVTVNGKTTTADAGRPLVIDAGAGNDVVKVDPSVKQNTVIKGGLGDDQLTGGGGNDRIEGGAGNDRLAGSLGNDYIKGEAGKDTIDGGPGKDYMIQDNSWIETAQRELGVNERNNDARIRQYHNTTNARGSGGSTPWCSSFANWVMEKSGYKGTDSAGALSWKNWGKQVPLSEARPGDLVFFEGKTRSHDNDHVGFVVSHDPNKKAFQVLGGNQSDAVTKATRYYGGDIAPPTVVRPNGVTVG